MKSFFSRLFNLKSNTTRRHPNDAKRYRIMKQIGKGAFGTVYQARDRQTGELVAIKKIPDTRKSRARDELQYNLELSQRDVQNVVQLLGYFTEKSKQPAKWPLDLCLVFEYFDQTLRDCIERLRKKNQLMNQWLIKIYTFQMFRALHWLHSRGIIHRDIKPSNFLIDKETSVLKISDFGIATRISMKPGESRCVNVCSRPYKAPELELGNENYDQKIDIWSAGCVFAECFTGQRLFRGVSYHYQDICELLGDPTKDEILEMQPLLKDGVLQSPQRKSTFHERLHPRIPAAALELLRRTLAFRPSERPSAIELCAADYYDPMRAWTSNDDTILYNFSEEELVDVPSNLIERIVPPRCRNTTILRCLIERHLFEASKTISASKSTYSIGSTTVTKTGKSTSTSTTLK